MEIRRIKFIKNLHLNELMPMLQSWLSEREYEVYTVANRIDAIKDNVTLKILLEDYANGCIIRVSGQAEVVNEFVSHLSDFVQFEQGIVQCEYCGTVFSVNEKRCPNCGAYIKLKRK